MTTRTASTVRALGLSLLVVVLIGGAAFGAGFAVKQIDDRRSEPQSVSRTGDHGGEPSASPSSSASDPSPSSSAPSSSAPSEKPSEPAFRIKAGATGEQVRELQQRLFQLAWFGELTTGTYDDATAAGVRGFQAKRGLPATGTVDQATWNRLVAMTETPTHDQLFNILRPGPAILAAGASGDDVRDLQARLKQIDWFSGDVTGEYGDVTAQAVRGFQTKRQIPVTGEVDQRTLDRLHAMTTTPTHDEKFNVEPEPTAAGDLDSRCLTGRVLCIDKTSRTLRWVIDGKVIKTMDARFGSTLNDTPTREGQFSVYLKSEHHVSKLYGSSMPYAMFFDGGQAVHYSSDFATYGYGGASHGCVNIRDYAGIQWLFGQVQVGDKVVVYWS